MGNKVIWPEGSVSYEPWSYWLFKTIEGETIKAGFTDKEITKMKQENPEIKWN